MIEVRIENLNAIRAAFLRSPREMTRNLNKAIKKTALNIQGRQQIEYRALGIGIITRGLISSIQRGIFMGNLRAEVGPNVIGSPGVPYAIFVHQGTRRMRSRPFLAQAVRNTQRQTDMFFKRAVRDTLSTISRRAR